MTDLVQHIYETALALNRAAAEACRPRTLDVYDDEGQFRGNVEAGPNDTRASLCAKFREESGVEPGPAWRFCRQHTHEVKA